MAISTNDSHAGFVSKNHLKKDLTGHLQKEMKKMKQVQLISFAPGRCVQILHTGPFRDEPTSLARIMEYMDQHGLVKMAGTTRFIYPTSIK